MSSGATRIADGGAHFRINDRDRRVDVTHRLHQVRVRSHHHHQHVLSFAPMTRRVAAEMLQCHHKSCILSPSKPFMQTRAGIAFVLGAPARQTTRISLEERPVAYFSALYGQYSPYFPT